MTALATRSLHLLDIENVLDGRVSEVGCAAFYAAYGSLVGPTDEVIVGGTAASLSCTFSLPRAWRRVVGRRGPDGADLALLDAMPETCRLPTYRRIFIVSRDHIFTAAARLAHGQNLDVVVVAATTARQSRALSAEADHHIYIDLQLRLAA